MVFEPAFFDCIDDDTTVLEKKPMTTLINNKQLMAYTHKGFWQCMDTLREKEKLERLWNSGNAPWKKWED